MLAIGMTLLAACDNTPVPEPVAVPRLSATPVVNASWTSCAAEPSVTYDDRTATDAAVLPLLDPGFRAVRAVVCYEGAVQKTPGSDLDPVAAEVRADDIGALMAQLRESDEAPPTPAGEDGLQDVCTAEIRHVPWVAVIDANGRWVRPGLPLDSCGMVATPVLQAIATVVENNPGITFSR